MNPKYLGAGKISINRCLSLISAALLLAITAAASRADEPYARSRDYDLQHSKIVLRFDTDQKKVIGEVTHTLSLLRDSLPKIEFDSVGLTIQNVTVNKAPAKFETTANKLVIPISSAKTGDKFEINIRYEGKPTKGLYFILPDKDYPDRPKQIWTQGESEDTRYYLPTYDYPNDRLTTETILTVPSAWLTVANGKLVNVSNAPDNMKTWTWKESVPSSTYLITVVAGEFDEVKDTLLSLPLTYYAPKGRGDRLPINYGRTPAMVELFNKKFGVDYPWEKYAQVMVDDFVAGGMENSSATTNTSTSLTHPKLAPEYATGEDDLISHELAHQWFGDLVTCKDWGDIWLNEGFATFAETVWSEAHFPKDQSEYERWSAARQWFAQGSLYKKPIVRHDFDDSNEFDGNSYGKGGWVLEMLRYHLGEDVFNRSLKHYLEVNRGKNVVTADFVKAVEEVSHADVDQFFNQWIYGAGAPKFDVSYTYDAAKHQIALIVKQTQRVEDHVGIFSVPVDVEVTTPAGPHLYHVVASKPSETFSFPATAEPQLVLFDKGGHILKTLEFHKQPKEWIFQLKNAAEFSDRADAAIALRSYKDDSSHNGVSKAEIIASLSDATKNDSAWGVRATAADSLGQLGGADAANAVLAALDAAKEPWLRARIVAALGNFKDNEAVLARLRSVAEQDTSYRAKAAALQALGKLKAPSAYAALTAAIAADSPDNFLRDAALRALGPLADDKAVPVLREWAALGKPMPTRNAAIASLASLQKDNKEITTQLASYLSEPHFSVRLAALFALGSRGDASAIPAMEALLNSNDLSIAMAPTIKGQIAKVKRAGSQKPATHAGTATSGAEADDDDDDESGESSAGNKDKGDAVVVQRLDKLEELIQEMNDRLKSIETRLPPKH